MKPHLCFLNWSNWSHITQGFDYKIQVRKCLICNRENHRRVGWAGQTTAKHLNDAIDSIGERND